jgi:hypothetical protein
MTGNLPENRSALTDEQLRTATIGELLPHAGTVQIVDYDPQWARHL